MNTLTPELTSLFSINHKKEVFNNNLNTTSTRHAARFLWMLYLCGH